ncbi:MAG: 30S ribosomal protein S1 [Bdellovibrio sp. CG10_big_fil_rev_8_21_14_0_10_47_8]|nr:MAG: 30S ribosomal protein S1 [Bdellovibrio sp. CG10_big_fil_rev_8_21_14_0_10_47_8]
MFENSLSSATRRLSVGDRLRGEILSIGKEDVFVSTGTAQDALMARQDLNEPGKDYKVGDQIDIVVTKTKGDQIRVVRAGSKSAPADIESLEDAFDMELPVEGKVTEVVNGGYRVSVHGQSAFCPFSQIDARPTQDTAQFVGKKMEFLITQYDAKKRNVVVSRRRLLDLQKVENEGAWLQSHKVGDLLHGTITRLESFGAFVSLEDGVEGLAHISELAFHRLKHPSEVVHPGDPVQVKILKIDEEGDRLKISLSVKQAGGIDDPWMQIPQKFPVGTLVDGVVEKKEVFGLFISIDKGLQGLLPKSKWRDSTDAAQFENKKKGDVIKVRIDEIKFEERKISLGLPTEAEDLSWKEHQSTSKMGAMAAAFAQAGNKPRK